ncbi:MAG: U32 family peptidase [Clostridia bacterium]|nr:U32 family peptidase [Clostridia bacterium]
MAEIMAPAGGWEQLTASVRSGANRVYFGCGGLNARRNADGFNNPTEVIEYCHARGVKATAALNILLTDKDLQQAALLIEEVARAGGDGIIVQDFAAYRLVKEICPELPLHASTQMTIHNVEGALALEQMGFARAVLARELSFDEIAAIRKATKMELEVFVHGALCMSVSGQCYLSSMLGGRSGNRGLCAQPCRLEFTRPDGKEYALSLKDMSHLAHIKRLAELGVDSFKIEGRMKRPEYAAAAVTQTLAALNGGQADLNLLADVFSRSGFTDGYLTANRNESMFGHRVKEDTANTDKVLPTLTALYRNERQQVPVDMALTVKAGQPITLTLTADPHSVTVTGAIPNQAVNRPLTEEFAKDCLFKCGGTPYLPQTLTATIEDGLMVPIPALKGLRKEGLEQLTNLRITTDRRATKLYNLVDITPYQPIQAMSLVVSAQSVEQIEGIHGHRLILPTREILKNPHCVATYGDRLIADLPALSFGEGQWQSMLTKLKDDGIKTVRVHNVGALFLAKQMGFFTMGGTGLNITNTMALAEYKSLGLDEATLSFELAKDALHGLGGTLPRGAVVYGRLPLMRLRACPLKKGNSCVDCKGQGSLTDRKGVTFPLSCTDRQFTTLYNSVPLYLGDKRLPIDFGVVEFTNEDNATCRAVIKQLEQGEKPNFPRTCGLYERTLL